MCSPSRTLIIADEGSYVHYVEGCTAPIYDENSLHSGVIEIFVKKDARVRYTTIQNWSTNVLNLVTQRAMVEEGGTMEWVDGNMGAALFDHRTLGHQVENVRRPVLNGRVTHASVLLHEDLDNAGVQRVLVVDRSGAALDVVHVRTLVGDDERALKLTHRRGVDAEVRLQRDRHVDALGDVDEGTTGPGGGVQRGELIVTCGHALAEVLLENLRVLAQAGVGVGKDDALTLQVFLDLLVDDLRFVLSGDAGMSAYRRGRYDAPV